MGLHVFDIDGTLLKGTTASLGVRRGVTAVLERPLGNRVLLDVKGAPVIVSLAD